MTLEERVSQLADLACELAKRIADLEKKVGRLETATPAHLKNVERRNRNYG
jgi:hypothetical protein